MAFYRVVYSSMTARYGPSIIEADSAFEAKKKFAGTAFSRSEFGCISATEIPSNEVARALRKQADDAIDEIMS